MHNNGEQRTLLEHLWYAVVSFHRFDRFHCICLCNNESFCSETDVLSFVCVCVLVCHIGSNLSGVYRMQLAPGHYVFVQTKSKLFKNSTSGQPEFIMSTHSIVRCVCVCVWCVQTAVFVCCVWQCMIQTWCQTRKHPNDYIEKTAYSLSYVV